MNERMDQKVTGYKELDEYPDYPAAETPTKADCAGYTYMSMVQLCNISESLGKSRSFACNAFGGDNGDRAVQWSGFLRKKDWGGSKRILSSIYLRFLSSV